MKNFNNFMDLTPRPAQQKILTYSQGTMGVTAVPGSGKTWTLSLLAVKLITSGQLDPDQEVLIVTLVNSAVNNFTSRISSFLEASGLIPSLGYRVRTLHGLAHDIVTERPDLIGLDSGFQIIDEREAIRLRRNAVNEWLLRHPRGLENYLLPDLNSRKKQALMKKNIPDLIDQIALQFIKTAKDLQLSPDEILSSSDQLASSFPLVSMGVEVYASYQRDLAYQGALDFDDLIRYALKILQLDEALLYRLQDRWPYILEDEAQDSSRMQEKILSLLAGNSDGQNQNWVRMGDPNQAIYETFTTANPRLLVQFAENADQNLTLPNSGRSTESIINLANFFMDWVTQSHPVKEVRSALFPIHILPTPPGDAQPNPEDQPDKIYFHQESMTPEEEMRLVGSSLSKWQQNHPDETAAVLVPRNQRGKDLASFLLNRYQIEAVELLNSTLSTRKTSGALVHICNYLVSPDSSSYLASAYKVWKRDYQKDPETWEKVEAVASRLSDLPGPEIFTSHEQDDQWLSLVQDLDFDAEADLGIFKKLIIRWQKAVLLPIDQLILTLSQDIFHEPSEKALSQKLAAFLKQLSNQHPEWTLPDLLSELKSLARNERRFVGFPDQEGFSPEEYKGKVVITTAHKAKGLEWDRVYLLSVNQYNFPSGQEDDWFIAEKWFIRDQLNLPAETLAQLRALTSSTLSDYREGQASSSSRIDYVKERIRLLYVAITRARKELIITWNTGRRDNLRPAAAFSALAAHWESHIKTDHR